MITVREEWRNVKIGARFGRLTIVGWQFRIRGATGYTTWQCVARCVCGGVCVVGVMNLIRGLSTSCGCYAKEVSASNGKRRRRHGETRQALHVVWINIKARCYNCHHAAYANYGGRGIKMDAQWRDSYETFRDYCVAHGYSAGMQIDRYPDKDGNYEPGNIRFCTSRDNNRNRRNTLYVTAWGETKSLMEWAGDVRCVVTSDTLRRRITGGVRNNAWKPERALSTPPLARADRFVVPVCVLQET